MKPKKNPYASLKQPGIRGSVQTEGLKVHVIIMRPECSITIYIAELIPGIWDYGMHIIGQDVTEQCKYPGEGEGWFTSGNNALLYALGHIRQDFEIESEQGRALRQAMEKASATTLF